MGLKEQIKRLAFAGHTPLLSEEKISEKAGELRTLVQAGGYGSSSYQELVARIRKFLDDGQTIGSTADARVERVLNHLAREFVIAALSGKENFSFSEVRSGNAGKVAQSLLKYLAEHKDVIIAQADNASASALPGKSSNADNPHVRELAIEMLSTMKYIITDPLRNYYAELHQSISQTLNRDTGPDGVAEARERWNEVGGKINRNSDTIDALAYHIAYCMAEDASVSTRKRERLAAMVYSNPGGIYNEIQYELRMYLDRATTRYLYDPHSPDINDDKLRTVWVERLMEKAQKNPAEYAAFLTKQIKGDTTSDAATQSAIIRMAAQMYVNDGIKGSAQRRLSSVLRQKSWQILAALDSYMPTVLQTAMHDGTLSDETVRSLDHKFDERANGLIALLHGRDPKYPDANFYQNLINSIQANPDLQSDGNPLPVALAQQFITNGIRKYVRGLSEEQWDEIVHELYAGDIYNRTIYSVTNEARKYLSLKADRGEGAQR